MDGIRRCGTMELVCIAAKLRAKIRRVRLSAESSSGVASSMSQESISSCRGNEIK